MPMMDAVGVNGRLLIARTARTKRIQQRRMMSFETRGHVRKLLGRRNARRIGARGISSRHARRLEPSLYTKM